MKDFKSRAEKVLQEVIYPLMWFREGCPSEGKIIDGITTALQEARDEALRDAEKVAKERQKRECSNDPEDGSWHACEDIIKAIKRLREEK